MGTSWQPHIPVAISAAMNAIATWAGRPGFTAAMARPGWPIWYAGFRC